MPRPNLPIVLVLAALVVACPNTKPAATPDAGSMVSAAATSAREKRDVPVTTRSKEALAEFHKARGLAEETRRAEALEGFKKAMALDPDFALALAYYGYYNYGATGMPELQRAAKLAENLDERERLLITLLLAKRQGQNEKAAATVKQLLKAAPDEWRASFELGQQAYEQRNWNLAIDAYRRSMELADLTHTCIGYNNLGYAQAMVERFDLALLALKRCADLRPKEPNPHDSLGEVALAAGRFAEAEASFQTALKLDPAFYTAWEGIAVKRFYENDVPGAFEAVAAARKSAALPSERAETDVLAAWMHLAADGKPDPALKQLDVLDKEAKAQGTSGLYDLADGTVHRAAILLEAGKPKEALAAIDLAISRASAAEMPGGLAHVTLRRAYTRKALILAKLGRTAEAEQLVEKLVAHGTKDYDQAEAISGLHFARGAIAAAKGDLAGAKAELSQCVLFGLTEWSHDHRMKPEDSLCLLKLAEIHRQQGNLSAAADVLGKLRKKHTRDPVAVYVWSRAAPWAQGNRAESAP